MAKHLLLGDTANNWRLHVDEDALGLPEKLDAAARAGERLAVMVVLGDALDLELLWVNPAVVPWWAVIDVPDPDELSL